jgi:hypothetical protein
MIHNGTGARTTNILLEYMSAESVAAWIEAMGHAYT